MGKYQDKNVGFLSKRGTSVKKPVTNEDDGSVGGYHVEHWDDSQDAVVQPKTVKASLKMEED